MTEATVEIPAYDEHDHEEVVLTEADFEAEAIARRQAADTEEREIEQRRRIESQAVDTGLVRVQEGGVTRWIEPRQAPASHQIAGEIEALEEQLAATDRNKLQKRLASLRRKLQNAIRAELEAVPRPDELLAVIDRQRELDAEADAALTAYLDAIDLALDHREREYDPAKRAANKHGVMFQPATMFAVRRQERQPGIYELGNRAQRRGMPVFH